MKRVLKTGGNFSVVVKDVVSPLSEKIDLYSDTTNTGVHLFLRNISKEEREYFENSLKIRLHEEQIVFDVEMPELDWLKHIELSMDTVDKILFSLILSLEDIHTRYDGSGGTCSLSGTDGLGSGLPLAIFRLSEEGINSYHVNDDSGFRTKETFIEYSKDQIEELKKTIKETQLQSFDPFISSMLIHVHTLNWVKQANFILAAIILFSCFERVLEKKTGEQISHRITGLKRKEQDVLQRFQLLRNAIAHPSQYNITLKGKLYVVTRLSNGKVYAFSQSELPEVKRMLVLLLKGKLQKK